MDKWYYLLANLGRAVLLLLIIINPAQAQINNTYKPHEVFEIGNGEKVEVLGCKEDGEIILCDVIYYTTIRQQGKRKWENINLLRRLQQAEIENKKQLTQNKSPEISKKVQPSKTAAVKPLSKKTTVKAVTPVPAVKKAAGDKKVNTKVPAVGKINNPVADTVKIKNTPVEIPVSNSRDETAIVLDHSSSLAYPVYSLDDCYKIALAKNLQLKKAQNNITSNVINRQTAYFSLLPSVSYNLGHYFSYGKNIDPVTNAFVNEAFSGGYTSLGIQLDVFTGFNKINTIKQTGLGIEAAAYGKKQMELELLGRVTLAYARLLFSREQLIANRNNIETTLKEIDIINEKIKVGRLTKYEFYTFNARLNTQQVDLITNQNDSLAALQEIKQLLNIPVKQQIGIQLIDTAVLAKLQSFTINPGSFIDTIIQNHPAIKKAKMDEEVAQLGVKTARSIALPSLSLGANLVSNYNINQLNQSGSKIPLADQLNNNLGKNINLSLRIPLFSQMENANRVKKERLNVDNARLETSETENTIATNTMQLLNDFTAARQKYLALQTALQQNQLSFNMYQEKYRLGQISSMELITAADILNTSNSKFIQAKLDYYFRYKLLEILKTQ